MAEDVRRSAEIRRMASHKVAIEFLKVTPPDLTGDVFQQFVYIVDKLDADVVEAGDRATRGARVAPNMAEPVNGSTEADTAVVRAGKLDGPTAAKFEKFLNKFVETDSRLAVDEVKDGMISLEALKLHLWTQQIPNEASFEQLAKMITEEQARGIHAFIKERLELNA